MSELSAPVRTNRRQMQEKEADAEKTVTESSGKKALNRPAFRTGLWALLACIAIITFAVYLPSLGNGFVNWDDDVYVYDNPHLRLEGTAFFKWAFSSFYASNWHPLTWISHKLDYILWGLTPAGHHGSSIVLHSLNTGLAGLLVFLLVYHVNIKGNKISLKENYAYQKAVIAGSVTALLFGIHPIHVESVTWIAERKDVLCAFFVFLSVIMYIHSVTREDQTKKMYYPASLLFFAFALLSKPMAVTLPVILLLLDIYPLRRLSLPISGAYKQVLAEKVPFVILSLISAVLTFMAQHAGEAIKSFEAYPLVTRLLVAAKGLFFYLIKMIVPAGLSHIYIYPHKASLFSFQFGLPILFLLLISVLSFFAWRKGKKVFLTVWLFYVIMLLPVIGIIQIGGQPAADRYAYMPSIGPFLLVGLAVAWGAGKVRWNLRTVKQKNSLFFVPLILVFLVLGGLAVKQQAIWKNGVALWTSCIQKFPEYIDGYINRANAFIGMRDYKNALRDLDTAISLRPDSPKAYLNRGTLYKQTGDYTSALSDLTESIKLKPSAGAYNNRALVFEMMQDYQAALRDFGKAVELEPDKAGTYINRCTLYGSLGAFKQALRDCSIAIEKDPYSALAYATRGLAYSGIAEYSNALKDFDKSLLLAPGSPMAYFNRGQVYLKRGDFEKALGDFNKAVTLDKEFADQYMRIGILYGEKENFQHAVTVFSNVIALDPENSVAYYNRGNALYRWGKEQEALDDFRKAARLGDKKIQEILKSKGIDW